MAEYTIEVKSREVGKSASRKLRSDSWAPGIIYGSDTENMPFSLEAKYVDKYKKYFKENPIFVLKSDDKKLDGQRALLKEITYHPVNRKVVHMDLLAIKKGQAITVTVEVKLVGEPKGVKLEGGNLSVSLHTIELECLPKDIPSGIEHDISELGLDESIHVSDLNIPDNMKVLTAGDVTIATIHTVKEEVETPAEAAPAETAAAPATEEKKD